MEVVTVAENKRRDDLPRFPLNDDCMYEVFKRLHGLEECMNLAESFKGLRCVADFIYKTRFSSITISFYQRLNIDRIMNHIGPFIKTLEMTLFNRTKYTVKDLMRIQKSCTGLETLSIIGYDRSDFDADPFSGHFSEKLESLKLACCSLDYDDLFFKSFTIGESLTMMNCDNISHTAMKNCFEKNQQIETFVCNSRKLQYEQLLDLLPNLKRLELPLERKKSAPTILSKLKSLRSLSLHCKDEDINDILSLLTIDVKQNLEELELVNVVPNAKTFEILAEFGELRELIFRTRRGYKLLPTDQLPPKLITIKLRGFHICKSRLVLLVEQQKEIENIVLSDCILTDLEDLDPMVELIAHKCNVDERNVHLTLTVSDDLPSKEATIQSGNFSVTGYQS